MTEAPATLGTRIGNIRRHFPLTQEELAARAGVSVDVIKKLERGERQTARMDTVARLARALRVATSALLGDAAEAAATREDVDDDDLGMLDIRRVLTPARGIGGYIVGEPTDGPATIADVQRETSLIDALYHHDQYDQALRALPGLITTGRQLISDTTGEARADAYATLASAYRIAGKTLLQVRRLDLAHIALTASLDAADHSSDPALVSARAVSNMCWLLTRQGRFADAEALAVATADQIEPRFSKASPLELANWGWLLLYASGAAARDNRPDDAREQLSAAEAAALRIGELPRADVDVELGGFSTPKVQYMRVESAIVQDEPGQALALAAKIEPSTVPTPSCRHRHQLDVAAAHLATGGNAGNQRAGEVLLQLGRTAPRWMKNQRYARNLVDQVTAGRRRRLSDELAQLTALVGATGQGDAHPVTE